MLKFASVMCGRGDVGVGANRIDAVYYGQLKDRLYGYDVARRAMNAIQSVFLRCSRVSAHLPFYKQQHYRHVTGLARYQHRKKHR
jgi:hypothetical protein